MNSKKKDDFELQPLELDQKPRRNAGAQPVVKPATQGPVAAAVDVVPQINPHVVEAELAEPAPRDASVPQGPGPSNKVDFENHPEFVWQREMLRTVRLVAIFVTLIIAIVLIVVFFGAGKGAKDSLKTVIDGEQPAQETKQ